MNSWRPLASEPSAAVMVALPMFAAAPTKVLTLSTSVWNLADTSIDAYMRGLRGFICSLELPMGAKLTQLGRDSFSLTVPKIE